jgi:hypothetical protein
LNNKGSNMKTKQLGNSDLFITPVGFGAWAIGGSGWEFGWGEQDDKASVAAIHRALDLGVNWIDTAAVYGMGHSEEVVAFALRTWPGPRPIGNDIGVNTWAAFAGTDDNAIAPTVWPGRVLLRVQQLKFSCTPRSFSA